MTYHLGLAKIKQEFPLFRLLISSLLMLGLWSYPYAYEDPYVASLISFLCFAFCFVLMLMLMLTCEPGLLEISPRVRNITPNNVLGMSWLIMECRLMDTNCLLVIFFNQAYFDIIIVVFRIRSCNTSCHSNKSYIRRLLSALTSHFRR